MKKFYSEYKGPIAAILIFILLGGFYSYKKMKTGLFPNITFPKIKIIADNGQQPIKKMIVTVTVPLENAIKKVQNLKMIRSITSRGSCEISAFLEWNTNIDLGKQRVEARINAIRQDLPPGINISIEKMNPSILPVMGYSLEGKGKNQIELKQIALYTVKPFLSRIEGISEIAVIGGKTKEFRVILNPLKLSALHITPQNIFDVLKKTNFIVSNGYNIDYNRLYLSITDASIYTKKDLENTIIKNTSNRAIRVKDIATVKIAERKEYVKINANGKNIPLIAVIKQPNANLVNLDAKIQAQVKILNKLLPKGVVLKPYYNQADFVNDSVRSLLDVLWIGLLLAMMVTVLFLRSLKASSVLLMTIPITLSLTLLSLFVFGYTINIMTIGAIAAAIGLIIDDAIVVVEQIHRLHEENPNENSFKLVGTAVHYLLPAMIGSSLSTIVIFFPFVLMGGVAGAYFKVMADTMMITLISSFFVTWIGLPVIYILFSKKQHKIVLRSTENKRKIWISFFIKKPIIAGVFIIIMFVSAVFIIPKLPSGFLPHMDEGSLVIDYKSPPGTSLEATDKMLQKVDSILKTTPGVNKFSRRVGTQMGFFITEPNTGDYLIQLKKSRSKTTMEVADEIRKRIESSLPALKVDFGQVIGDMLGDLMSSVQPVAIKIFGDNPKVLEGLAKKVAEIASNVRGTADVFDGIVIAGPEMIVKPNLPKLAQYNISPQNFQFQLQSKIDGVVAGTVLEQNKQTDIRLTQTNKNSVSVNDIRTSSLFLPNGEIKPIGDFAKIKITNGVAEVERENLKPMVAVTARLNNRDLGSTLKAIQKSIHKNIVLPVGYNIEYGGAYAEQQKAFRDLMIILILASFLVFVDILFLFKNIKAAISIISLAVIGTAGSLLALYFTNTPLNVGSYTGIIMIVGIIGENSIFTYMQYKTNREKSGKDDAIVEAISLRFRPNLMTALGAIVALFPLALGIGTGAQMHQPLAIAIIGGFVVAIPILLVALPSVLRLIEKE